MPDIHVPTHPVRLLTASAQGHTGEAASVLDRLTGAAVSGEDLFAVLMDTARVCSLQQVTESFFEVGGHHRRNV